MPVEITRDLVIERLGSVKYDRFLFYLMGPYKSFNLNYVLSDEERREIEVEDLPEDELIQQLTAGYRTWFGFSAFFLLVGIGLLVATSMV